MDELPVVRVTILRADPALFTRLKAEMAASVGDLAPGIRAMSGNLDYYAGADQATSSLTNVSVWRTLADARQMETFEPMLALGRRFAALGASFERPIMNYATLWRLGPQG